MQFSEAVSQSIADQELMNKVVLLFQQHNMQELISPAWRLEPPHLTETDKLWNVYEP